MDSNGVNNYMKPNGSFPDFSGLLNDEKSAKQRIKERIAEKSNYTIFFEISLCLFNIVSITYAFTQMPSRNPDEHLNFSIRLCLMTEFILICWSILILFNSFRLGMKYGLCEDQPPADGTPVLPLCVSMLSIISALCYMPTVSLIKPMIVRLAGQISYAFGENSDELDYENTFIHRIMTLPWGNGSRRVFAVLYFLFLIVCYGACFGLGVMGVMIKLAPVGFVATESVSDWNFTQWLAFFQFLNNVRSVAEKNVNVFGLVSSLLAPGQVMKHEKVIIFNQFKQWLFDIVQECGSMRAWLWYATLEEADISLIFLRVDEDLALLEKESPILNSVKLDRSTDGPESPPEDTHTHQSEQSEKKTA